MDGANVNQAPYSVQGDVAVITMSNPPVNGLGLGLRRGIVEGMSQALADPASRAIVLTGAGKAFSGGADTSLGTVIDLIEGATKPVIAAVHSVAMGGGLELALGCHFRVASPGAQIALPEVKLGVLPGAGGTQRLPRVVPFTMALNMIVSGQAVPSEKFKGTRLFDAIIEGDLLGGAVAFARQALAEGRGLPRVRDLKVDFPMAEPFLQFARNTVAAVARNYPAPRKCVEAVAASVTMSFDECTPFPATHEEAAKSMHLSMRWAARGRRACVERPGHGL
ncbi:MAG: enoyl-CoA hydratase-related protein, partial [Burkholderiales bacterium]|nr:enoyl-CoA hydratase-related protein [Burkholderiales bacterium]